MIVDIKTSDLHTENQVRNVLLLNGFNFNTVDSYSQGMITDAFESISRVNVLPFPVSFVKGCAYYDDIEESVLEDVCKIARDYVSRINSLYRL